MFEITQTEGWCAVKSTAHILRDQPLARYHNTITADSASEPRIGKPCEYDVLTSEHGLSQLWIRYCDDLANWTCHIAPAECISKYKSHNPASDFEIFCIGIEGRGMLPDGTAGTIAHTHSGCCDWQLFSEMGKRCGYVVIDGTLCFFMDESRWLRTYTAIIEITGGL